MICGLKPGHYSSKHTKSIMKVNMKCEQPVEKSLGTLTYHMTPNLGAEVGITWTYYNTILTFDILTITVLRLAWCRN